MDWTVIAAAAQQAQNNDLQVWIALAAAIFGGAGLKAVEVLLNKGKAKEDTATQIREELRQEVKVLRAEIKHVEGQLDLWKSKYYELLQQFIKTQGLPPPTESGGEKEG